ncbi:MAG: hypothetical protein K1X85_14305 [Ignavibacteria bacterium]|nr:hypothetical protein [Ignavibacteria bacterium]
MKTILILCNLLIVYSQLSYHAPALFEPQLIRPLPTSEQLNSVCATGGGKIFAAGNNGAVVSLSLNTGVRELYNSRTPNDLNAIIFADKYRGTAVGEKGTAIFTTDAGLNWHTSKTATSRNLHDLCDAGPGILYAVGLGGTVLRSSNCGVSWNKVNTGYNIPLFSAHFAGMKYGSIGAFGSIMVTKDSGKTWSRKILSMSGNSQVVSVFMADSSLIYASSNTPHGTFIRSTDGGLSWTETGLNLPFLFGGAVDLVEDMAFRDRLTGMVITKYGTVLRTTDGGDEWTADTSLRTLYDKSAILKGLCIDGGLELICGGGGGIIGSPDSDSGWHYISGGLSGIFSANETAGGNIIAAGESCDVIRSTDSGLNWNIIGNTGGEIVRASDFFDSITGYACGGNLIHKTSDGGLSWQKVFEGTADIRDIESGSTTIAVGGDEYTGRTEVLACRNGIGFETVFTGWLGIATSVAVHQAGTILVTTASGKMLSSADEGLTWTVSEICDQEINCICFADSLMVIAGSHSGIVMRSQDGGNSWIASYSGSSQRVLSVCSSGNMIFATGSEGFLSVSADFGASWEVLQTGTSNSLNTLVPLNDGSILCLGDFGTVIKMFRRDDFSALLSKSRCNEINVSRANQLLPQNDLDQDAELYEITEVYDVSGRLIISFRAVPVHMEIQRILKDTKLAYSGVYIVRSISDIKITARKYAVIR